jgi:chromosome segregation ATPase
MIKKLLLGAGGLLVLLLLFRNCDQKVQIAYLEGELHMKEQALGEVTKGWEAALKIWAAAENAYKEEKVKLEEEVAIHMGNIDSLNTHVVALETSYTELEHSGASCALLLANMTMQRDTWRNQSNEYQVSYDKEHQLRLTLEVSYESLRTAQEASERRYAALESVCSTLRTELKVAKRANVFLGLQGKALKVVAVAEVVVVGYLLLQKHAAPQTAL